MMPNFLNRNWWLFEWRYWRGRTPWDTQITPPEVMEFLAQTRPGRALDLGCGTGTNAITLARHGWRVTGVDFSPKAIGMARRKAARAKLDIDFRVADVAEIGDLEGTYDYGLDIGCLFTLNAEDRERYAHGLVQRLKSGGIFMLYAWLPKPWRGRFWGVTPEEVYRLFAPFFLHQKTVAGEEKGSPTAWYWFMKR